MSRRSGAARRALNRILADPEYAEAFADQTRGMTNQADIDRVAIEFSQQIFEALPDVAQVEREARARRAEERRQQAAAQLMGPPMEEPPPPPPPPFIYPAVQPGIDQFREWVNDHRTEILQQGRTYIVRSGDTYYTLSRDNYFSLIQMITDYEYGFDVFDEFGSDARLIIEIANTEDFEANEFIPQRTRVRNMRPDQNRGSFLPYIHIIDDEFVEAELARYGLWREVKAENYATCCLLHSLTPMLNEEVLYDIKLAVRNASIPRKHLRHIGLKYNLKFIVHTDGDKNVPTFGDPEGQVIELCLYNGHYFPYIKDTKITGFALRNWRVLKEKYPTNWYTKAGMGGQGGVGVSSMRLIKQMLEPKNKLVVPIDISNPTIWQTVYIKQVSKMFTKLEYPDEAIQLVHPPRGVVQEDKRQFQRELTGIKRNRAKLLERDGGEETVARLEKQISERKLGLVEQSALYRCNMLSTATIFFDFESCSQGKHEAYFVAWQVDGENEVYHAKGPACAVKFLEWIEFFYGRQTENEDQSDVTLIAHNVSYDISFILEHLQGGSMKAIKKGSRFISASGAYKTVNLTFKDSYKIIPSALREFSSMFNLPYEKEVMPYDVFTHEFIAGDFLIHPDEIAATYSPEMVEQMRPNIEKHGCICQQDGERWDMLKYSQFYCERDVELLNAGWNAFRTMTMEFFDLDINAVI